MGRWIYMLGGLLIWAAHFFGIYGVASVADVIRDADTRSALWIIGGYTVGCAGADAAIAAVALRRLNGIGEGLDGFIHGVAALGAGLSFVAVIWQGLAALVGR